MTHRRKKHQEKSVHQRGKKLPWELPVPLDRTHWPSAFCENLRSSLFGSGSGPGPGNVKKTWKSSCDTVFSNMTTMQQQNENNCQNEWLPVPGTSGASSSHFPTVAFTDIKCDSKETELHSSSGKTLPPIGVFWDIENCSVPKGRSALVAVQRIREKFFVGHVEAEFLCVCDIRKEAPSVIQKLNDAQVSVIHVSGNSKNTADDKLRQAMRRFADISCSNPVNSEWLHPATVVLISGDINFVADLSDLRYRKRLYIILLHNRQTPDALLLCAHEQYEFHSLLTDLPFRAGYKDFSENSTLSIPMKGGLNRADVILSELPLSNNVRTQNFIRNRLRKLSENCGGRVVSIRGQWAVIRFPNYEAALRASKRMNGEDVLGNKIKVVRRQPSDELEYPYPAPPHLQEELSHDSFNMQCNKPSYGNFGNSSVWKPTWKSRPGASDSFRHGASRQFPVGEEGNYQITQQSNSSSVETSRDDSPTLLAQNAVPSHLNNSNHGHPYPSMNATGMANNLLTFHHSLHPNMEFGVGPSSVIRQEYQQHQTSSYQHNGDANGTSPRLYSTMGSCENNVPHQQSPLHSRGQMNFDIHGNSYGMKNSSTAGNGMGTRKVVSAPLRKSSVQQPLGETVSNTNGGTTENYAKFRNSEGDSFDLNVTNTDPSIGDWKAIRTALTSAFADHVNVRGIWVSVAGDGSVSATVRLNNKDEAYYVVAQLHRRKIGNKRIFISFEQGNSIDYATLKKEVASLLQDVPNHTLPLFKFREMFEKRYKRSVSSSDLYRMKDVVMICESSQNVSGISTPSSGRNISLAPNWHSKEGKGLNLYCKLHAPKTQRAAEKSRTGWAEKEAEVMLPNVIVEIKLLGTRIHSMLQSHDGGFPLISFIDCYEAEFGTLELATEGKGVPLEHLIACIQGVEIVYAENGMKRVQWHEKKDGDQSSHQPLATQLAQFGRELIDLLKTFPKCTLPFSRLIPSYHAHFGRQCRVADYGHFSLVALLQTLPHIIQIMGAAQNRVLTLSHRAQMKRFATDMLRVLKSQGGPKKQIRMDEFSSAFANVFLQRQFHPEDYGLCFFSDLVTELVEHSTLVALVKDEDGHYWLAVPKREQTPHEIYKTRLFAAEVVELLRHSTRCELEFSKFVPYYHHHFQKQCRVSDYGFSKLAELFDAINDTVIIINNAGNEAAPEDKIIRLTPTEQIKVVGEQVCSIIEKRKQDGLSTKVEDLVECFLEEHGFFLRAELCGASSLNDLITSKLESFVKVVDEEVVTVDRVQIEDLSQKAETLLQKVDDYTMTMEEFVAALSEKCGGVSVNPATVEKDLCQVVLVSEDGDSGKTVRLSPLRVFAHEMTQLLEAHSGSVPLSSLDNLYLERFGRPLHPAQLRYTTVLPMLQAISDVVSVIGKQRTKRNVVLTSLKAAMESTSDDSSSTYGRHTPRNNNGHPDQRWKSQSDGRYQSSGGRYGKFGEGLAARRRRSLPPPPLFSPLASPHAYAPQSAEVFTFDRATPLTPPMYDMWVQESVAPGSPPMSPPVVWTCHPIFYPSSPNSAGPGNILVTSPYVTPTPWSPPPMNSNCYESIQTSQPQTMLGNEYLPFGQTHRLAASFDKLAVSIDDGNEA